jgi:hypothetical protein
VRFDRVHVRVERRLRVDDHLARLGHAHDQIGTQYLLASLNLRLLGEVAVLDHARQLDQTPQRELTPAAAHFRSPQRRRQIARLALQDVLHVHQAFDLAGEHAVRCNPRSFELGGLCFLLHERRADRLDELLDGFFALLERRTGLVLVVAENFARELEEGLAVGIERRTRRALDRRAHLRLGLREQLGGARAKLVSESDQRAPPTVRHSDLPHAARRAACRSDTR